jgi:hypothetical protein
VLGHIIGFITSDYIKKNRIKKYIGVRRTGGFIDYFERKIEPTETQKDTIRKILLNHFPEFIEIAKKHRKEIRAHQDSLRKELAKVLSDEQMQRLEHMKDHIGRHPPKRHDGPPFHRPDMRRKKFDKDHDEMKPPPHVYD